MPFLRYFWSYDMLWLWDMTRLILNIESASRIYENFYQFSSEEKICFLMNSDVLQFNIANCLLAMFRRRKHAKI